MFVYKEKAPKNLKVSSTTNCYSSCHLRHFAVLHAAHVHYFKQNQIATYNPSLEAGNVAANARLPET
jgi:hypothetical protein